MKITYKQITEAITAGYNITVTINGECYELTEDVSEFKEGMKAAAAVIEDAQARKDFLFNSHTNRMKRTKTAEKINAAEVDTIRFSSDLIRHITAAPEDVFDRWLSDYKNNKLWRL